MYSFTVLHIVSVLRIVFILHIVSVLRAMSVLQLFDGLREELAGGAGELADVVDPDLMMAIHEAEVPEVFRSPQEESVDEDALCAHLHDGVGGVIDRWTSLVGAAEGVLRTG